MSNFIFSGCFPEAWIIIHFPNTPVHGQTVTHLPGITCRMCFTVLPSRCDTETGLPLALVYHHNTQIKLTKSFFFLTSHNSHEWMGRLLRTCYLRKFGTKNTLIKKRKTIWDFWNFDALQPMYILLNIWFLSWLFEPVIQRWTKWSLLVPSCTIDIWSKLSETTEHSIYTRNVLNSCLLLMLLPPLSSSN